MVGDKLYDEYFSNDLVGKKWIIRNFFKWEKSSINYVAKRRVETQLKNSHNSSKKFWFI